MSGNFVVFRMSMEDINLVKSKFPGCEWSGPAHAANSQRDPDIPAAGVFPGWTAESRALLDRVRDGRAPTEGEPKNRNNIPPHRYLEFKAGITKEQEDFLRSCYWVNDLVRPAYLHFKMKEITNDAVKVAWSEGKKVTALIEQIKATATEIEIYYLGRKEMV